MIQPVNQYYAHLHLGTLWKNLCRLPLCGQTRPGKVLLAGLR